MTDKVITLTVTPREIEIILTGLNELPHKISADPFIKIKHQVVTQLQEQTKPKESDDKKE
jgi:hypothetical protein